VRYHRADKTSLYLIVAFGGLGIVFIVLGVLTGYDWIVYLAHTHMTGNWGAVLAIAVSSLGKGDYI
jgi:hypothetical protein